MKQPSGPNQVQTRTLPDSQDIRHIFSEGKAARSSQDHLEFVITAKFVNNQHFMNLPGHLKSSAD